MIFIWRKNGIFNFLLKLNLFFKCYLSFKYVKSRLSYLKYIVEIKKDFLRDIRKDSIN